MTVDYANRCGKMKINFSKGTHIDRHKWTAEQLAEATGSLSLLDHLREVYDGHVGDFAVARHFPPHVCVPCPPQPLPSTALRLSALSEPPSQFPIPHNLSSFRKAAA